MTKFFITITCLLLVSFSSACYRMPTDEDYSLIPSTNHPDYTRESGGAKSMPGVGY